MFTRIHNAPILTIDDIPFRAAGVLNPGATTQDGEVVLLLRVEDTSGRSNIHVARSHNGVDHWRIEKKPILRYGLSRWRYELWGCEDARVTWIDDKQAWYITYTAASPFGAAPAIARSDDLDSAQRLALMFAPNNKDAVLLPSQCGGRYAALHRPEAGPIEHIWSAYSHDLLHWGEPHCVLPEGTGPAWDAVKVGAGPPPVLTDRGWLLIYHGVKNYGGALIYRAGIALLEREQPHRLVARCPEWIFQAEQPYERTGFLPGTVFPTGLLRRGDELWMYYGAADACVGLATARLEDVMAQFDRH